MLRWIKYEFWPIIKVWLIYRWWILKYGGRKNIPPELIWERMMKSMERMNENLRAAMRVMPPDASEEEKRELFNAIRQADELEKEARRLKMDNKE